MAFVGRDVRRVLSLIQSRKTGQDAYADLVLSDPENRLVKDSAVLFEDDTYRKYIEACILASDDLPEIAALLGLDLDTLEFYSKVYYDAVGLTVLQKVKLAQSCLDIEEKALKMWAVSQGLKFLAWRLGFKVEISPVEGVKSLYADSFFKAKEAFFSSGTSKSSQEALRWAKMAMDGAKVLKSWVTDMDAANEEIRLALKEVNVGNIDFGDINEVYESNGEVFEESVVGDDIEKILKQNASSQD